MTKKEIVTSITEKTGIDKGSISIILEEFMREIISSVVRKEVVHLRFFGSFFCKKRASKPARNIKENTTITIPERYIPYFKPSAYFKQEVIETNQNIYTNKETSNTYNNKKNK